MFEQGEVGELKQYNIGDYVIPFRDIVHKDGLVRIEYYHNEDPDNPTAFPKFRSRMAWFQSEYGNWQTVVNDSVTFMELSARKHEEKIMNPAPAGVSKFVKGSGVDTRQWFAGSTDALEEMVVMRFAGLPMNVCICCHIDERRNEVSGEILRGAFAPGRLSKRGELMAAYQEQYHSFGFKMEDGGRGYAIHTQNDGMWSATTQIDADNPCYPHYESLWGNWKGGERPPMHVMVYGDSGTGKSTFAQTFPKPMLVWFWDPFGKDLPYWKGWKS
jgi:hypothetical protein